ncbi:hypothetical protein A1OE_1102 [Candidatus Endolissoclinum faulkneri L2]|uniref:Uncharacterized protein n=1 Tax=Candidatus Endolissoclinum faulkneri L2 TaxID=1193729 RepID=K7YI55_9PROT|nr:hypothetical protein A1OE_1102 [Candidatus Endolissoclinum faulkneri L2]
MILVAIIDKTLKALKTTVCSFNSKLFDNSIQKKQIRFITILYYLYFITNLA